MKIPTIKRETSVTHAFADTARILFYATPDAKAEFEQFGTIQSMHAKNRYLLDVDPRFDFDEVLEYIKGYGQ